MSYNYNKRLKNNAQRLRKEMTREERKLWFEFLSTLPIRIKRQKMIGRYIVDFYCASAKAVIELDGSQHYEESGIENDVKRDDYLNSLGITVYRYSNRDVNEHFEHVCEDISRNFGLIR